MKKNFEEDSDRIKCITEGCNKTANYGYRKCFLCYGKSGLTQSLKCSKEGCMHMKDKRSSDLCNHHYKMARFVREMSKRINNVKHTNSRTTVNSCLDC